MNDPDVRLGALPASHTMNHLRNIEEENRRLKKYLEVVIIAYKNDVGRTISEEMCEEIKEYLRSIA